MKSKNTIAYTMGDLIQRTSLEDMDERTRHRGKICIMDMLGVILAAWPEESTQILYRVIKRHGGLKESSVLGAGDFLPAAHAALINSAMAHSLELEDHHSHTRSLNHPGVCTIAPALAISERENKTGRDFLVAVILGYEIGSRISRATRLGVMNLERGFHESSICGPFSAATATGKLMAANPDVLANAMGICGSTAAGSMEFKSNDPDVLRLAALVEVEADPTIDKGWPAQDPTEIMITLKNGRMLTASVSEAKGDLNNPVTDAELFDKFKNLVLPFLGRDNTERAIEMIMQIERLADVKSLSTLFRQANRT